MFEARFVGVATVLLVIGASSCAEVIQGLDVPYRSNSSSCQSPPAHVTSSGFQSLALGQGFLCAVRRSGRVVCMGRNTFGALGTREVELSSWSDGIELNLSGIREVAAVGPFSVCALGVDGRVWCWGNNQLGVLGNGRDEDEDCNLAPCRSSPTLVRGLPIISQITSGGVGVAAVGVDGSLWYWGAQLDDGGGQQVDLTHPHRSHYERVAHADVVSGHVIAYHRDGSVSGLAVVGVSTSTVVVRVFRDALGGVCAVDRSGRLQCNSPQNDMHIDQACFSDGSSGFGTTCVVVQGGSVFCWGQNDYGECGISPDSSVPCAETLPRNTRCTVQPNEVWPTSRFTRVSVGSSQACAIRSDGVVWCWGNNWGRPSATPVEILR